MKKSSTRYDHVPISQKTREGMTLNSNDLQAIGRLLSLQDNVYDEEFEKMFLLLNRIETRLAEIEHTQAEHEKRIKILEDREVRIRCLEEQVEKLIA
jgi:hypothetical protein